MCVICKDWKLGKLTNSEAIRAINEMLLNDTEYNKNYLHLEELYDRIKDEQDRLGELDF